MDNYEALIRIYYEFNPTGRCCHIALDDGNLDDDSLFSCQEYSNENNDLMGFTIATTLRYFTEEEREEMYDLDWWGMKT